MELPPGSLAAVERRVCGSGDVPAEAIALRPVVERSEPRIVQRRIGLAGDVELPLVGPGIGTQVRPVADASAQKRCCLSGSCGALVGCGRLSAGGRRRHQSRLALAAVTDVPIDGVVGGIPAVAEIVLLGQQRAAVGYPAAGVADVGWRVPDGCALHVSNLSITVPDDDGIVGHGRGELPVTKHRERKGTRAGPLQGPFAWFPRDVLAAEDGLDGRVHLVEPEHGLHLAVCGACSACCSLGRRRGRLGGNRCRRVSRCLPGIGGCGGRRGNPLGLRVVVAANDVTPDGNNEEDGENDDDDGFEHGFPKSLP